MSVKLRILLLILASTVLGGCSESIEGACEYYYEYSSSSNYYCSDESADGSTLFDEPSASDACFYGDGNSFHEDSSCDSIGYDYYQYSDTYSYNANKDPSPYGSFGGYSGGSSGGSSGSSYNCSTVWTGSPDDIQVSSFCDTACVYLNAGSQAAATSTCDILSGFGSSATNSCSVCP
jgi:hypothetical protein